MNTSSNAKRIIVATLMGVVVGLPCAYGTFSLGILNFTAVNLLWVLLNRGVMGFAVGVSGLKLPWAWNGIVVGLVVGSIFSYSLFMRVGPEFFPAVNAVVNGLFGLVIEFFTTIVFKLPARPALRAETA